MYAKYDRGLEDLLKMIDQNPDLPVIPFVSTYAVVGDSQLWWSGRFDNAEIHDICIGDRGPILKCDDDPQSALIDMGYEPEEVKRMDKGNRQEIWNAYDNLPWRPAICVYIGTR